MKRQVAIITYELNSKLDEKLAEGIDRFKELMKESGLEIACDIIGDLTQNPPPTNEDGNFDYNILDAFTDDDLRDNPNYAAILKKYSDVLFIVNRRIFQETPSHWWHTILRNGEAYGGARGDHGFITLRPLEDITEEQETFMDYVIRHELGHMLGNFRDLPEDAEDSIMKPILKASDEHLRQKNTNYTDKQIGAIRDNNF